MLTTFIIALREYLEAFLIIGVFLGISKKLKFRKEKEILLASFIGILISIILPLFAFYFSDLASKVLTKKNSEILEGYLLIFSGGFISYVIFSLHKTIHQVTDKNLIKAHSKMKDNLFDLSLFLLIVFFIVREGFEIALFTATTSLFSSFSQNLAGLILAFFTSLIFSLLIYASFLKISFSKIYKLTEWMILFLGAAMIVNGVNEILEGYFRLKISHFLPIKILFLPEKSTFIGHLLKNLFGIQRDFSLVSILIIFCYIFTIKKFFLAKK